MALVMMRMTSVPTTGERKKNVSMLCVHVCEMCVSMKNEKQMYQRQLRGKHVVLMLCDKQIMTTTGVGKHVSMLCMYACV